MNNLIKDTELLLSHNADTNILNKKGESPMHIACKKGYRIICELLIKHKADLNLRNSTTG